MSSRKPASADKRNKSTDNRNMSLSAQRLCLSNSKRRPTSPSTTLNATRMSDPNRTVQGTSSSVRNPMVNIIPKRDYDLEATFIYNEYLQALMKMDLVLEIIARNEHLIKQRIIEHKGILHKFRCTYNTLTEEIDTLEVKEELLEVLRELQENMAEQTELFSKFDLENTTEMVHQYMKDECDKVLLRNIYPLVNDEEKQIFMDKLRKCVKISEEIVNSGRKFEEVKKLADGITNCISLATEVAEKNKALSDLEATSVWRCLSAVSDNYSLKTGE